MDKVAVAPESPPPAGWQPVRFLLALVLAAAGLFGAAWLVPELSCTGLGVTALLLSLPIWVAQRERVLFTRRLLLEGAASEQSLVRRLFWSGRFTAALLFLLTPFVSFLVLVLAAQLQRGHWWGLGTALLGFALLAPLLHRVFARELKPEHAAVLMRRWPLRLTLFGLIVLFLLAVEFAVTGGPDLRALQWQEVVTAEFERGRSGFSCELAGLIAGAAKALEGLRWYWAQTVIPGQPDHGVKLMAWLLILLPSGLLGVVFTDFVCGLLVLTERRGIARLWWHERAFSFGFFAVILLAAALTIYAKSRIAAIDPALFQGPVVRLGEALDPCRHAATSVFQADVDEALAQARARIDAEHQAQIDEGVARLFAGTEGRVDAYLDWYFSLLGEYTRLAMAASGEFPELMQRRLEEIVFMDTGMAAEIAALRVSVLAKTLEAYTAVASETQHELARAVAADACLRGSLQVASLFNLEPDLYRTASAAGAGVASGVLAKKVISATVAKVAGKQSFKLAASAAAKAAAKKGGSALVAAGAAAAVCAPSGPVALLCGATTGTLVWLGTDKLLLEVDESLHRAQMKADILAALDEARAELSTQLQAEQLELSRQLAATLQRTVDGQFIPRRDGL